MTSDAAVAISGVVVALASGGARDRVELVRGSGVVGDPHAGNGHRQVSVLASEALDAAHGAGGRGEHVQTRGVDVSAFTTGRRFRVGERAVLQVTARELTWLFARVLRGGVIAVGDVITTESRFDGPRFAVITLSDRSASGARADESGPLAAKILGDALGAPPQALEVLPDDARLLEERLIALADEELCDLIVTTGGTGLAPRDVTPEATLAVIDREVPGIAEAIRAGGLAKTPHAMLSRGVCGQRGSTLIVNLSGSPKAVREQLAILMPVIPHVLTTASGVPQTCGVGNPS